MPRIAWLTDIHLNFLDVAGLHRFFDTLRRAGADALWLTGDVSESRDLLGFLESMSEEIESPLFFVLGNHDYYFSSIAEVRTQVGALCERLPKLHYLTRGDVVAVTPRVGLVGHDGWADGRLGDYVRSLVMMNDYKLIRELAGVDKQARQPLLAQMGDEAAALLARQTERALVQFEEVYVLTHVPPFADSCVYEGRPSDAEWLPHFSCYAAGQALLKLADAWPNRHLTVLCGHTHGETTFQPRANLVVHTGGAQYGAPSIARVWEV